MNHAADKPGPTGPAKLRVRIHADGSMEIDPATERRRSPRSKD